MPLARNFLFGFVEFGQDPLPTIQKMGVGGGEFPETFFPSIV